MLYLMFHLEVKYILFPIFLWFEVKLFNLSPFHFFAIILSSHLQMENANSLSIFDFKDLSNNILGSNLDHIYYFNIYPKIGFTISWV